MISLASIIITVNTLLVILTVVLGYNLVRASSKFNFAIGDVEKQTIYKRRVLKIILTLSVIGLTAAVFNILLGPI